MASTSLLIRTAEAADALAVARVHVRSWQVGYRGLLPDAYLDALKAEERAQRYSFGDPDPLKPATLVALADGQICAFATVVPTGEASEAELAGLYVAPEHWSHGIGTVLLAEARVRLAVRGFSRAVLWVLAGNTRARRFYEHGGWRADDMIRDQEVWGITVQESRYSRRLP